MKVNDIQLIIFDLDGTIVEVRDRLLASCRKTFRHFAMEEVDEATCWQAVRNYELEKLIPQSMRAQFFDRLLQEYNRYGGRIWLVPGTIHAFQFCRQQGYRTAVMTARPSSADDVRSELEMVGLAPYIDLIKTQQGVPIMSALDKAQRLLEVIRELGVLSNQSLYIGDLPDDISSARRAGLGGSVAVLSGGIRRELLAEREPDVILSSIGELPAYLKNSGQRSPSMNAKRC